MSTRASEVQRSTSGTKRDVARKFFLGADLAEREEQLEAAGEANRDLIKQFNRR